MLLRVSSFRNVEWDRLFVLQNRYQQQRQTEAFLCTVERVSQESECLNIRTPTLLVHRSLLILAR